MTAPTVPVTIRIADFGGPAVPGITVTATMNMVDYTADGVFVGTEHVQGVTDVNGELVMHLFPNAAAPAGLGTRGSTVRFTATLPGSRRLDVRAAIPNAPCDLTDILVAEDIDLTEAQRVLQEIQADMARAEAAAESVEYIYPGTYAVAPTTRPDGSPRQLGDVYFDSASNLGFRWNGATWASSDINTANLAAAGGAALIGFDASLNYAVGTVGSHMKDGRINVKDFPWLVQGGGADDTAAIQYLFDNAPTNCSWHFPDNNGVPYKVTTTITATRNGITLTAPRKNGFEKVAIYCTNNAPILQIVAPAVRVSAEDLMFLGDKGGNRTGTNPNTEPLLYVVNGAATTSMLRFSRCDFRRGNKLVQIGGEATSSLHFEECAFYNATYGFIAPEGVDNVVFDRCNLEGLTTPFDVAAGSKIGLFILRDCYLEANATDPVSVGVLRCARPVIEGNKLNRVRITWGKGVSNPVVHGNRVFGFGAAIDIPPLFALDMDVSGMTHSAPKRHGGGSVQPLSMKNHISSPGYIAGDGLDYVIVTNAQRKVAGASSTTVEFLVDAGVISSDVLPFNAVDDQYGSGGDLTTFGVVNNTGAAISCTALTAADYLQKTTIYQSLLQNGTFPAASTAKWLAQGGIVAAANGAYLRLTNPGAGGNFVYNRIVHVPINCKQVWTLARVKTGQGIGNLAIGTGLFGGYTNSVNQQGYAYCSVQVGYFDNGDGTTDDLVSVCANVLPGAVLAKTTFGLSVPPGSTFDVKWICAVPVVEEGAPIYAGTFTWDPANLAAAANTTSGIGGDTDTVTDLKQANVGDFVRITPPYTLQGLAASAFVGSTSSMTARLDNPGAAAVDLASGVWRWELIKQ